MTVPTSYVPPEVVLGTTTSWLPVTTAYPSVSGCASAFFLYPGQPAPFGWDPGYGYFAGGTLRCFPPEATSWWELPHQNPDGYTSLSIRPIVCPAAFTTAATELRSGISTLVMCCPSGYTLQGGQPGRVTGACASPLTSGQIIPYTARADNGSWVSQTWTITASTTINAVAMDGWNVAASTASTGTTSSVVQSTSTSTSTSTALPPPPTGLSTGAKAGIGVGVAVAVVGVILLALLFFHKRRRTTPQGHLHQPYGAASAVVYTEKPAEKSTEMPATIHEMHDYGNHSHDRYQGPVELSGNETASRAPTSPAARLI